MNPLAADIQRFAGINRALPHLIEPPREQEEGLSFSQKFKTRILNRHRLPALPELLPICERRYAMLLEKPLKISLEHYSREFALKDLLSFFYSYQVTLAGKMAKVVLGKEWFSQVAKDWVDLQDEPELCLPKKTDIDFRIEVQNEDPSHVAQRFLEWLSEEFFSRFGDTISVCNQLRRSDGSFSYFGPIVEGDLKGNLKTNVFLISYKSENLEVDFFILNKVLHSAALTHENLALQVNPGIPLAVFGSGDGAKGAVIDYLSKELNIVNEHPKTWARTVCDRLAGFHLTAPLPEALLFEFSEQRIGDLEKLYRHRFEPSEATLHKLGQIALRDLIEHQVDPQWIRALFEKINEMGCHVLTWRFLAYHFRVTGELGVEPEDGDHLEWIISFSKMQKEALGYLRSFFLESQIDVELEVSCLEALLPLLFLLGTPEQFKREVVGLSRWLLDLVDRHPQYENQLKQAFGGLLERGLEAKRSILCKSLLDSEFSQRYPWTHSRFRSSLGSLYLWQKRDIAGALSILFEVQEFYIDEDGLALELLERLLNSTNAKEVKQGLRLCDRIHFPIPGNLQTQFSHVIELRDKAEIELRAKKLRLPEMLLTLEAHDLPNKYARLLEVLQVVSDLPNEAPGFQAHMPRIVNILHRIHFKDEELPAVLELLLPLVDPFLADCKSLVNGMVLQSPPQTKEEVQRLRPLWNERDFPWMPLFISLSEQKKYELLKELLLEMGRLVSGKEPLPEMHFLELLEAPDPFQSTDSVLLKIIEDNVAVVITDLGRFFSIPSVKRMILRDVLLVLAFARRAMAEKDYREFGGKLLQELVSRKINVDVLRQFYAFAPKEKDALAQVVNGDPAWWVVNKPEVVIDLHSILAAPVHALVEPFYERNEMSVGSERLLNFILNRNKDLLFQMIRRAASLPLHRLQFVLWKQFFDRYRNDFSIPIENRADAFKLMRNVFEEDRGEFCKRADAWFKEIVEDYFSGSSVGISQLASQKLLEVLFTEVAALIFARFSATKKKDKADRFLNSFELFLLECYRHPDLKEAFEKDWHRIAIGFVELVTHRNDELHFSSALSMMIDALSAEDPERLRLAVKQTMKFSRVVSVHAKEIRLDSVRLRRCWTLCEKLDKMRSEVTDEQCISIARNFALISPFKDPVTSPYTPESEMVMAVRSIAGVITLREQTVRLSFLFDDFIDRQQSILTKGFLGLVIYFGFSSLRGAVYDYYNISGPSITIVKH
ncbi:MAG: hypothetical protein ACK5MA_01530 [Parachlamydiaceae bacterium]